MRNRFESPSTASGGLGSAVGGEVGGQIGEGVGNVVYKVISDIKVSILEYSILFSLILCLLSVLTVAFGGVRQIETLIATQAFMHRRSDVCWHS